MEPVTIILALCIPLAFGVGWRVGLGERAQLLSAVKYYRQGREEWREAYVKNSNAIMATEAKRHTQRMAALAKANATNRAKRDAS